MKNSIAAFGSAALLGACSTLPQSGPSDRVIISQASRTIQVGDGSVEQSTLGLEYVLVELHRDLKVHRPHLPGGSFRNFGSAASAPAIRLGPGDVVQVTVFESQSGGLFVPAEAGSRPGNFVALPAQEIGQNGQITVPYAGPIRAAGKTASAVEALIERQLGDRAIEPEVSITVLQQNSARAALFGLVNQPGTITLSNGGDRVLDVIAGAGGIQIDPHEAFVTLTRNGRSRKVPYERLTSNPAENIYLAPGDTVNVTREFQRFMVFGATGGVGEFAFDESRITLNEAVAKAGGLTDDRADPSDVFVYRLETPHAMDSLGITVPPSYVAPGHETYIPVIYRLNYRKPDSFFLAQLFEMRADDVVYVSNADSVNISKLFGVLNTASSGSATVRNDIDTLSN